MYNFKSLTAATKFLSYKEWGIGGYVVGIIHDFRPNNKNPKNKDVIVKVIESNLKNDKMALGKDDLFTINGTTALQKVVDSIEEGDILKVTFLGTETVKSGQWQGTKANKLDIQVAAAQDAGKYSQEESNEDEEIL